jgi:hypothetical protein
MNTDSFFTIGSTHKVCQDYALDCKEDSIPHIIISDGCSSAPHTDFGSRLLTKAAQMNVHLMHTSFDCNLLRLFDRSIESANIYRKTLDLPIDSLSATLLAACVDKNAQVISTVCVGDGAIIGRTKDGWLNIFEYEFKRGAPYYLRYELNPEDKTRYFKEFGNEVELHVTDVTPSGEFTSCKQQVEFTPEQFFFWHKFPLAKYDSVVLMTDGIQSFIKQEITGTSKQNNPVDSLEIIKELMNFKNYSGDFLQRRCQMAFRKFRTVGIQNYDDFSMAVITTQGDN